MLSDTRICKRNDVGKSDDVDYISRGVLDLMRRITMLIKLPDPPGPEPGGKPTTPVGQWPTNTPPPAKP